MGTAHRMPGPGSGRSDRGCWTAPRAGLRGMAHGSTRRMGHRSGARTYTSAAAHGPGKRRGASASHCGAIPSLALIERKLLRSAGLAAYPFSYDVTQAGTGICEVRRLRAVTESGVRGPRSPRRWPILRRLGHHLDGWHALACRDAAQEHQGIGRGRALLCVINN